MNFFRKPKCFIFRWLVCTQTHLNLCNVWQQVRFEMFEYPQKILKKCNHLFICIFPTHFYVIYLYSMKNKTFSRYNNALIIVERPELCKQALLIEILCSCRKLKETLRANRQYQSIIMSFFFWLAINIFHISREEYSVFGKIQTLVKYVLPENVVIFCWQLIQYRSGSSSEIRQENFIQGKRKELNSHDQTHEQVYLLKKKKEENIWTTKTFGLLFIYVFVTTI